MRRAPLSRRANLPGGCTQRSRRRHQEV